MIIEAIFMMIGFTCGLIMIEGNAKYLDLLWGDSRSNWALSIAIFGLYNLGLILLIKAL